MHILEKVEQYCSHLLLGKECEQLPFHNFAHTTRVVRFSMEFATALNLSKVEIEEVVIAAWFHDTGFSEDYAHHEEYSKVLARSFLEEMGIAEERIQRIVECVESTKYDVEPKTLQQKILCDADLIHLTSPDYLKYNALLRQEWEQQLGLFYSDLKWYELNVLFLSDHHFESDSIPQDRMKQLKKNLGKLKKLQLMEIEDLNS